tara:strand:+ start:271 stop:2127 length:1857 start_codon:yes stop_codon:yes gene_type:complete
MSNKLTGDSAGMSYIISNMKNTMPADQYIREVNKNAEEAIQRVQKIDPEYKGQIVLQKDEEYYKKNKVDKLCVIDNGDGMSYDFLNKYMLKLGASLRGNKHKNFGAGFKISALPFNSYGIIVCSWVKGSPGYMLWVHYNDKKDEYEAKMFNKSYVIRLEDSVKPKEITDQGTKITFLGDFKSQNTMLINPLLLKGGLFKGGRKGQSTWITSFLNTKKYFIEKNIKTVAKTDLNEDRNNITIVGHYESLNQVCIDKGTVSLNKATVDWFLLPEEQQKRTAHHGGSRLTVGQLATVHEDEVLKVDYAGKSDRNPLAAWGHQYSKTRVALVLKPDINEFRPNLERTNIFKEGLEANEYFDNWKEEWQQKTPEVLVNLEKTMMEKAIEKFSRFEDDLKKYANLYRNDQYMSSSKGDVQIEKDKTFKTGGNKNIQGDDKPESDSDAGPNPDKEYGEIEQELGIKVERSTTRGVLTQNNPYPNVGKIQEGEDAPIAQYVHDTYSVDINTDALQIRQLVEYRVKKDKVNNYESVKTILLDIIEFQIKQQVAHIVNLTGWESEQITRALSSEALSACLANKSMLLEKLDQKLVELKSVIPAGNWPKKDEHIFHLRNNPNKFPILSK